MGLAVDRDNYVPVFGRVPTAPLGDHVMALERTAWTAAFLGVVAPAAFSVVAYAKAVAIAATGMPYAFRAVASLHLAVYKSANVGRVSE